MPARSNGYFNDPVLGQAFANLASAFGPPSAQDSLAYASANATRQKASMLAKLFASGATPSEQAALAGFQEYGNTPAGFGYKVDMDAATTRRGQDISLEGTRYGADRTFEASRLNNTDDNVHALQQAALEDVTKRRGQDLTLEGVRYGADVGARTSLATNRADNQRQALTSLFGPLNPGEVAPAVPAEFASAMGLPAVPQRTGRDPILSEEQVKGAILRGLPASDQRNVATQGVPVEQIIAGDGRPQIVARNDAIGRQPYVKPSADSTTEISRLIAERDTLPAGDPNRAAYDQRIQALGRGQQQSAYDKATDEGLAKLNEELSKAGAGAIADRNTLNTLAQAIEAPDTAQGAFGPATLTLRKTLAALNVPVSDTSPAEMINALGNQLALRLRDPSSGAGMPGAMSDADREFLKSMTVSLGNSPEANRKLVGYYLGIQRKNVDLENLRRDYVAKNGRLDEGFRSVMSDYLQRSGTYAGLAEAAPGAPIQVRTPEEAMRLPPGTSIRLPDGSLGVVPRPGETAKPAAPGQPQRPALKTAPPQVGTVQGGYRFRGGDPSSPASWERQ